MVVEPPINANFTQQYFGFNSGKSDDTDALGSFYHFKKLVKVFGSLLGFRD